MRRRVPRRVFEPELVRHVERGLRELDDARAFEWFEAEVKISRSSSSVAFAIWSQSARWIT